MVSISTTTTYHQRTDNGGGINFTTTYQLGDSSGGGLVSLPGLAAAGVPTSGTTKPRIIDAVLGIVTDSQTAYTRSGTSLTLNAPLTPAYDQSTIPYYNVYWQRHLAHKPTVTLNYGLGWALEMPPVEKNGKQVALVDASDEPIKTLDYLAQRKAAALQARSITRRLALPWSATSAMGSSILTTRSTAPSVRASQLAWNPHFSPDSFMSTILGEDSTVIRGGYGRVYGRLNGVGLVLTPLLAPGLIQAVQCRTAMKDGTCGSTNPTDSDGVPHRRRRQHGSARCGYADAAAASLSWVQRRRVGDCRCARSEFRPNDADSFNLTIQRQINRKMLVEVGYIGRIIHNEFQPLNLNTVPYMMSQGGQSFAQCLCGGRNGVWLHAVGWAVLRDHLGRYG